MKRDQNKRTKKLSLHKETLRELQLAETSVNGGTGLLCMTIFPPTWFYCY